jgi:hypothetical protein
MKAFGLGIFLTIITLTSVHAQRSPETLPLVTVGCHS